MRAFLSVAVVLSGCVVEVSDDPELSEVTSALGVGWCDDIEVPMLGLPLENGQPINVEEPFVRVHDNRVFLYFSDRVGEERDLHFAMWMPSGFYYLGRLIGVNSATGIEGAPSIDPSGHFYFTDSGMPGLIAHGTLSTTWPGAVSGVGQIVGMPPMSIADNVVYGNMDIGVSPTETFAILSRGAWFLPASGLPAAADLWYLRRYTPTFMVHASNETAHFLGALNTPDKLEYAPEISSDGLHIYYTQTTANPLTSAIMTASRTSVALPFGAPTAIIGPTDTALVEGPTVMPANDRIFYHRVSLTGGPSKLFTVGRCTP